MFILATVQGQCPINALFKSRCPYIVDVADAIWPWLQGKQNRTMQQVSQHPSSFEWAKWWRRFVRKWHRWRHSINFKLIEASRKMQTAEKKINIQVILSLSSLMSSQVNKKVAAPSATEVNRSRAKVPKQMQVQSAPSSRRLRQHAVSDVNQQLEQQYVHHCPSHSNKLVDCWTGLIRILWYSG